MGMSVRTLGERAMRGWRRDGEREGDGKKGMRKGRCIVVAGEGYPFGVLVHVLKVRVRLKLISRASH